MHNQLLTNRSNIKSDRISKILSAYTVENDKNNQQSFRMLSQKIKKKIGNQINDHQTLYPKQDIKLNKIEISKLFNEYKKTQIQISVKDLLIHKSQMQKSLSKKSRNSNQRQNEIIEKLNKTQNEIYKNYIAKRDSNGSKTYRDSRDLDIRIKLNNKSTSTQQALLQTFINKSNEKKSFEPGDSPNLCSTPQHTMLQSVIQNSLLLRSGSQGNVACTSKLNTKLSESKLNKIKNYLEQAKTHRPITDSYKLSQDINQIKNTKLVSVERNKLLSILKIAHRAKTKIDQFNEYLKQQEKISSVIQSLKLNELSYENSVESILSLE
ncbi:unnamed protein product [Paramecium pentaurelia]|uniref:Uncharacterized protein n=1 Tax=Paramecium pentaurelia TaxID=43138 RepID=A0A8S1VF47_9CILI|nr:unnamed protein product [Paramecium pentaurelia]